MSRTWLIFYQSIESLCFHAFFRPNIFLPFFSSNRTWQQPTSTKPQHFHEFFTRAIFYQFLIDFYLLCKVSASSLFITERYQSHAHAIGLKLQSFRFLQCTTTAQRGHLLLYIQQWEILCRKPPMCVIRRGKKSGEKKIGEEEPFTTASQR